MTEPALLSLARAVSRVLCQLRYASLRPDQHEIVSHMLGGNSVVAILDTNAGKSLCWQVVALLRWGITLVISPHVALIDNQVSQFNARDRRQRAAGWHSGVGKKQRASILAGIRGGTIKMFYITPEGLKNQTVLQAVRRAMVSMVVVDEAHCLFLDTPYRKAYLELPDVVEYLAAPQVVCASATIPRGFPESFIGDLFNLLGPAVVRGRLERSGHRMVVRGFHGPGANGLRILAFLEILKDLRKRVMNRGIIYCARKDEVPIILEFLAGLGISATTYVGSHATSAERKQNRANQDLFATGGVDVMVATRAFELGINVPDIRFVIYHNPPATLSNVWQGTGRGARDGGICECYVLFTPQDWKLHEIFLKDNIESLKASLGNLPKKIRSRIDANRFENFLNRERKAMWDFLEHPGDPMHKIKSWLG